MAEAAAETTKPKAKPGLRATLASMRQPRVATAAALGFSSGLPFLLTGATFGYWMRDEGIALTTIGFLSWVGLAYTFKFLWSPLVDRVRAPVTGFLGQRRGWVLLAQAIVCVGLVAMAIYGPKGPNGILIIGLLTLLVAVGSATQDIVVDAWRIESAKDSDEIGLLTSAYQLGYRAALLVTDALILVFAQHFGWPIAYVLMAAFMSVGVIAALSSKEPNATARLAAAQADPAPPSAEASPSRRMRAAGIVFAIAAACVALSYALKAPPEILVLSIVGCVVALAMLAPPRIYNAVVGPFSAFVKAHGSLAILMLAMISLYRLPEFLIGPVAGPFYSDLGLNKDVVGGVRASAGLLASILGIAAGGLATVRFGYMPSLIAGAIMQGVGVAAYSLVAMAGANPDLRLFAFAMMTDNFCYAFAGVTLITYMSSLTSIGYTATQYAFLSSAYTLSGKVLKGFSGAVVDGLHAAGNALMTSYAIFYVGTGLICLPAVALCILLARRVRRREEALAISLAAAKG
jgi:PAT family beta-lactamase induction signal transducer AmpG